MIHWGGLLKRILFAKTACSLNFNCVRDVFYREPLVLAWRFRRERVLLVLRTRTGCPVNRSIYQDNLRRDRRKAHLEAQRWQIEPAATQKIECPGAGRACLPIYDT